LKIEAESEGEVGLELFARRHPLEHVLVLLFLLQPEPLVLQQHILELDVVRFELGQAFGLHVLQVLLSPHNLAFQPQPVQVLELVL